MNKISRNFLVAMGCAGLLFAGSAFANQAIKTQPQNKALTTPLINPQTLAYDRYRRYFICYRWGRNRYGERVRRCTYPRVYYHPSVPHRACWGRYARFHSRHAAHHWRWRYCGHRNWRWR